MLTRSHCTYVQSFTSIWLLVTGPLRCVGEAGTRYRGPGFWRGLELGLLSWADFSWGHLVYERAGWRGMCASLIGSLDQLDS